MFEFTKLVGFYIMNKDESIKALISRPYELNSFDKG